MAKYRGTPELVEITRKPMKTKQAPKAVELDVHRNFEDGANPYILVGIAQNAAGLWIQPADEG